MTVFVIAGRELRSLFTTTIGWLVLCGYLLLMGAFWTVMLSFYVAASQDLVYQPYAAQYANLSRDLITPFFANGAVITVMVAPALSMRTFSEELRSGTLELLFTSPVSTLQIVLGKFLGVMGFVAVMQGLALYLPLSLLVWSQPDLGVVAGGALGLLLQASALIAMGMLFSAMTRNQVVALLTTFALSLLLLILDWNAQDPEAWTAMLGLMPHLQDLFTGAVHLSDLAYFVCFVAFFLFATHQRMESFRWR